MTNNAEVRNVKLGDVIMSDAFVNASESYGDPHEMNSIITIVENEECDARDLSRATAKYMVEHVERQSRGCFGPVSYYVQARRLNDDNTYSPDGELITFRLGGIRSAVPSVRKVGSMKFNFQPEQ